jgi:hypothetical protein
MVTFGGRAAGGEVLIAPFWGGLADGSGAALERSPHRWIYISPNCHFSKNSSSLGAILLEQRQPTTLLALFWPNKS